MGAAQWRDLADQVSRAHAAAWACRHGVGIRARPGLMDCPDLRTRTGTAVCPGIAPRCTERL
ncbi:hypothetical protein [Lysobacter gummosus]|uniref:hypothetical protein n=1 Tax=Lysobacter gummosus TaxID=262324 RepID=UPI00362DD109